MKNNTTTVILLVGLSLLACGCAGQNNRVVEYRISKSLPSPEDDTDMVARGKAQLSAGLNIKAIETFRAVIRHSADEAAAYNGLAIAYDRIGRPDLAQRYFEVAAAKAPADQKYRKNLARFFERSGQQVMAQDIMSTDLAANYLPPAHQKLAAQNISAMGLVDLAGFGPAEMPNSAAQVVPSEAPSVNQDTARAAKNAVTDILSSPVPEYLSSGGIVDANISARPASPSTPLPDRLPAPDNMLYASAPALYRNGHIYIERISLNETRLITRVNLPRANLANAAFEELGKRLETWLPDAIAIEQGRLPAFDRRLTVLFAAVQRTQIEMALANPDGDGDAPIDFAEIEEVEYHFYYNNWAAV